ncbi:hypothetical protein K7G98_09510 [Saccharothrix sp. MB29]|nr:hypothetical protein [Saccharothrix sp. MB29]
MTALARQALEVSAARSRRSSPARAPAAPRPAARAGAGAEPVVEDPSWPRNRSRGPRAAAADPGGRFQAAAAAKGPPPARWQKNHPIVRRGGRPAGRPLQPG